MLTNARTPSLSLPHILGLSHILRNNEYVHCSTVPLKSTKKLTLCDGEGKGQQLAQSAIPVAILLRCVSQDSPVTSKGLRNLGQIWSTFMVLPLWSCVAVSATTENTNLPQSPNSASSLEFAIWSTIQRSQSRPRICWRYSVSHLAGEPISLLYHCKYTGVGFHSEIFSGHSCFLP